MQTSQPLDIMFTDLDEIMLQHESTEHRLISRASKIPNLQYLANKFLGKPRCRSSENDVLKLVGAARTLDCELLDWATSVPATWSYSSANNISPPSSSQFIPQQVHR